MWRDRVAHLESSGFEKTAEGRSPDELGHLVADDVDAEDGAVRLVRHHLAEPAGLAPDERPAVAPEGHDPDRDLVPGGLGLGLAATHGPDLRGAVGRAGHEPGIERMRIAPGDGFDGA